MMPSQRRKDLLEVKQQLNEYRESKEQKSFLKRRAKLIRNHWRNGIAGVETVQLDSENVQVLPKADKKKLSDLMSRH